jgi:hypothetical protein
MNWYAYWTAYAVVIALLLAGCLWLIAKSLWDAYIAFGSREGLVWVRPDAPDGDKLVWYRGWECGFDSMAASYTGEGWYACFGGADLDCIAVHARTWADLLDEIDDHSIMEAVNG